MKKSRFSKQLITFILKRAEDGAMVEEVGSTAEISSQRNYRWPNKHGGLLPSQMKSLKQLEEGSVRF